MFSKMARSMLRGIRAASRQELIDRIHLFKPPEVICQPVPSGKYQNWTRGRRQGKISTSGAGQIRVSKWARPECQTQFRRVAANSRLCRPLPAAPPGWKASTFAGVLGSTWLRGVSITPRSSDVVNPKTALRPRGAWRAKSWTRSPTNPPTASSGLWASRVKICTRSWRRWMRNG